MAPPDQPGARPGPKTFGPAVAAAPPRPAPPATATGGADLEVRSVLTKDGVRLHCEVLGRRDPDAPTLLLAHGLGAGTYAWDPLISRFGATHRIVTWDYRGLFRSSTPARSRQLSIGHHARDALHLLDEVGAERATMVGWSMGVQVSLEAALEAPERIERLVLLNGSYGHIFETGLQPVVRLPGFHRLLHALVETLTRHEAMARSVSGLITHELHVRSVGAAIGWLWGNPKLTDMYRQYLTDVFGASFTNYLRLFQELDAHSVYHQLPEMKQPALVISGGLDWLTPAKMSHELARRLPNAQQLHLPLGSHFALVERTPLVLERIASFIATTRG